jgi:hypothetical protein
MRAHVQLIAWIHITVGVITTIGGLLWTFFWRLMSGWIQTADFSYQTGKPGHGAPSTLTPVFHMLSYGAIAAVVLVGIPSFISGRALLNGKRNARTLGIVASALNLLLFFDLISLIAAIYGLVILTRQDAEAAIQPEIPQTPKTPETPQTTL